MKCRTTAMLSAAGILVSAATATGQDHEPRVNPQEFEALRTEVQQLRAEVARFRQSESEQWLTERRAAEIRNLVAEVLADADTRATLLQDRALAGHDGKRFFLQSADGAFRLEFSGHIQIRFIYNQQDGGDDNARAGMEIQRARLRFDGHIYHDIQFSITGGFNSRTGSFDLVDAILGYEIMDELSVQVGRFRSPFLREEDVSSKRQLLVDRSLVEKALGQDRTLGGAFKYEVSDHLELRGSLMDASRGFEDHSERWQASARLDALLAGTFKQFDDFTSRPDDDFGALLGVAVLYLSDSDPDVEEDEEGFDELRWTVDVSAERRGVNVFAAVVGSHLSRDDGDSVDRVGVVLHAGVHVVNDWELAGRFEWGRDPENPPDMKVLTIGVNKYFHGHDLKFSADVGYAWNEISDFWNSTSAGWREDEPGNKGQVVVRTQLQLLF